ncbi:glycosyltransferase family 4 protein [Cellulophaga baltica]|uniref:glycosyltransferase family 4 protein n=1 Tax=Cellulophaga baltica TaxID=76594 RepID=UPI002148D6C7|nr:glycosyltransferase family 1 protein [Cellulophaga baltica]MCR1025194.1 glycosyltransferase family 4 protein [Cellulophaga baltica]
MNIILLIHQKGSLGFSMHRYEKMLHDGMIAKGHQVIVWGPKLYLSRNKSTKSIYKWLRYIDQYILFPIWFKWKGRNQGKETLYVLIDQALGIWTPLIKNRKHVIHCHDFIALKSAQGKVGRNPTSWSGRIYQHLILKGFSKAHNFISISQNTKNELEVFLNKKPKISVQIYNAIDSQFRPGSINDARLSISQEIDANASKGYILHVGGNTFYKNRIGILKIYNAWRKISKENLPLVMIGSAPTTKMLVLKEKSRYSADIHFLTRATDEVLVKAYQGASVFIFPSLLEGFGFPVAEAMASGCPVITTNEAPMNEVGGEAAFYIPKCPTNNTENWETNAATILEQILQLPPEDRKLSIKKGLKQSEKFYKDSIIDQIEEIYQQI